jgi:hypothetical protein
MAVEARWSAMREELLKVVTSNAQSQTPDDHANLVYSLFLNDA